MATWIATGALTHDQSHVRPLPHLPGTPEVELGRALADQLMDEKAIIGIFDEGCMGMYNAIIDDADDGLLVDRKSTRLNSSHVASSYAVFCLKKKKDNNRVLTT